MLILSIGCVCCSYYSLVDHILFVKLQVQKLESIFLSLIYILYCKKHFSIFFLSFYLKWFFTRMMVCRYYEVFYYAQLRRRIIHASRRNQNFASNILYSCSCNSFKRRWCCTYLKTEFLLLIVISVITCQT